MPPVYQYDNDDDDDDVYGNDDAYHQHHHRDQYEVSLPHNHNNINNISIDSSNGDDTSAPPTYTGGPVDLDELFNASHTGNHSYYAADDEDAASLFSQDEDEQVLNDRQHSREQERGRYFVNPHKRLLDNDASLIPGSPFSKPSVQTTYRPNEPLALAKYVSTAALFLTAAMVGALLFVAIWNYNSVARILIEIALALLSFMGLFWNAYFIVASIGKCFIPANAFLTNTKYCSIIPEPKPDTAAWLDVTIQIPVYKESLLEVLMPTLKSCQAARDEYTQQTGARCNIVVCDDGMMNFLRDNFAAAEMLWESIVQTGGRVIKLGRLLKQHVPRASRRHLKGLRSQSVYEVFHRLLYYYHYDIGFVARSTVDRRGKFKKASNLNSHLRLALGAVQLQKESQAAAAAAGLDQTGSSVLSLEQALLQEAHTADGARHTMFGNDVALGHLICVNDADARMSPSVITKTVPEFLNDKTLGFTQHATKTMNEQRGESYFTNLLAVYTDALYQGHFLLSSILGCHPPLVGHSIFLRTEAVQQCGRMRNLRSAYRWLNNIGLPFLPVDQVGFSNLAAANRIEYWSESHVSEDFELMIHLYNLGFNGRYCAYPDTEFQEGITRTFDEEAGRHRKFALGAHELVFNSFQDMIGQGVFTPLFRTFLKCDIPSYYKVFLTAYLCSYASGGAYLIVFTAAALTRIFDSEDEIGSLYAFSPAGIIILNFCAYYIIGYITFLISLIRMHSINRNLLFPEYRKKWCGALYLIFVKLRYCLTFQFLFYSVATLTFYFLGSMDHLLSRPNICGATNKDSIHIGRCEALWDMARFNSGSWLIAAVIGGLAYATFLQEEDWDFTSWPEEKSEIVAHALFAGPPLFLSAMCVLVPIVLNPHILGWPFLRQSSKHAAAAAAAKKKQNGKKNNSGSKRKLSMVKKDALGREIVDINTFMDKAKDQLEDEMERKQNKPDVEIGSLATKDLRSASDPMSPATASRRKALEMPANFYHQQQQQHGGAGLPAEAPLMPSTAPRRSQLQQQQQQQQPMNSIPERSRTVTTTNDSSLPSNKKTMSAFRGRSSGRGNGGKKSGSIYVTEV